MIASKFYLFVITYPGQPDRTFHNSIQNGRISSTLQTMIDGFWVNNCGISGREVVIDDFAPGMLLLKGYNPSLPFSCFFHHGQNFKGLGNKLGIVNRGREKLNPGSQIANTADLLSPNCHWYDNSYFISHEKIKLVLICLWHHSGCQGNNRLVFLPSFRLNEYKNIDRRF